MTKLGKRRAKQTRREKPQQQYYGGSQSKAGETQQRNASELRGTDRQFDKYEGWTTDERDRGDEAAKHNSEAAFATRNDYNDITRGLTAKAASQRAGELGRADAYGLGSDAALADYHAGRGAVLGDASKLESNDWMSNYNAGRGAILGGASALEGAGNRSAGLMEDAGTRSAGLMEDAGNRSAGELEGYARGAAGEYSSAADAAFKAATERNQRNALALAAGRGNGSIRTALATSAAGNNQAQLDQQVVRAQEANQLNEMRNAAIANAANIRGGALQNAAGVRSDALTGAAGIRSDALQGAAGIRTDLSAQDQAAAAQQAANTAAAAGIRSNVGAQDQGAAQLQAQRQQFAAGNATDLLGQEAGIEQSNAGVQQQGVALQNTIDAGNAQLGVGVAQALQSQEADKRNAYLGAEQTQATSQLGADAATDAQRQQWAKDNSAGAKFQRGVGIATLGILGSK